MPPGVNGDYGRFAYVFYDDSQFCHGLRMIGQALAAIGHPEAAAISAEAEQYRQDLSSSVSLDAGPLSRRGAAQRHVGAEPSGNRFISSATSKK